MLEILMLFLIGRHIAAIVKRKNRNPTGYVLMFVFGYIGAVIFGAIVGGVIAGASGMDEDEALIPIVLGYLIGIGIAICISYLVVCSLSPLKKQSRYDDYDDYDDEPRRRRRYEDDDNYDRPRSRRRDDDEDEYRPRSRRRDDDDDDWRPRRGPREDYE